MSGAAKLEIGSNVFIRGAVWHYIGKIVGFQDFGHDTLIVLDQASWVCDSARWSVTMATGELNVVEPYPDGCLVRVVLSTCQDIADWSHPLPRKAK